MPGTLLDAYVLETLMADLVGHDRKVSAFLVYLYLFHHSARSRGRRLSLSYARIAEETGLSKSAAQDAVRHLKRRGLVSSRRAHTTAVPEYTVLRPWRRN